MKRKLSPSVVVVTLLLISVSSMAAPLPTVASSLANQASAATPAQSASTQPQALPPTMPVYAILPTLVNSDVIMRNANNLNGVGATTIYSEASRGGLDHFFAFNPDTGNIIDQFNRTGGLFAVNSPRAFSETEMTVAPTTEEMCLFLASRQLFPSQEVEPQYTDCVGGPPYIIKQIHLATVDPGTGLALRISFGPPNRSAASLD